MTSSTADLDSILQVNALMARDAEAGLTALGPLLTAPNPLVAAMARGLLGKNPIIFDRATYQATIDVSCRLFGSEERDMVTHTLQALLRKMSRPRMVVVGLDKNLLDLPAVLNGLNKGVQLTIIDPSRKALGDVLLKLGENQMRPTSVALLAKGVQNLTENEQLSAFDDGPTLVYGNFSIHYLSAEDRSKLFRRLAASPKLRLLLLERDLNLLNVVARDVQIRRVWQHFLPHFKRIEQVACGPEEEELLSLKMMRLIFDALNPSEKMVSTWRCEGLRQWQDRLTTAGFQHVPRSVTKAFPDKTTRSGLWTIPLAGYGPVVVGYLFLLYLESGVST